MSLAKCPECGSSNISCRVKEEDEDEYKARMECDNCSYCMRWTKIFDRRYKAENGAEDEWNDPDYH